ncbi:MAG: ABC transporter permease [Erysipelotrichaceae bacterium]|nr:ABC transporter permease [Erysipelotrichaceae bacterium]
MMRNILLLWQKQSKELRRNKVLLIQFVLFPLLTWIMNHNIHIPGMPPHFFVALFAIMYCTMTPIIAMSSLLAEEKESHTLAFLRMAKVSWMEYWMAVGSHIFALCMLGALWFVFIGNFAINQAIIFMGIMALGTLISLLIGALIGTWSTNQVAASALAVPITMVLSFLPMLATFNEQIAQVAQFAYSYVLHEWMLALDAVHVEFDGWYVLVATSLIALLLYRILYNKQIL